MGSKIHSIVITSILAFALIAIGIPTTFENVFAQEDNTGMIDGTTNTISG